MANTTKLLALAFFFFFVSYRFSVIECLRREPGIIQKEELISNTRIPRLDDQDYGMCHLRNCSGTPCWCCMGRPICRPKGEDCEKLCPDKF
ncbi:hypothetical protein ACET3Z_021112 [Daucus carota]